MSPTSFVNVVMWCEEKSKLVCWCMNLESSALNPVFCVLKKYAAVFSFDSISFHWEVEIDLFIDTKLFEKTLIEYIFYWIHWIIRDACPCPSPENFQDCPAPPCPIPKMRQIWLIPRSAPRILLPALPRPRQNKAVMCNPAVSTPGKGKKSTTEIFWSKCRIICTL